MRASSCLFYGIIYSVVTSVILLTVLGPSYFFKIKSETDSTLFKAKENDVITVQEADSVIRKTFLEQTGTSVEVNNGLMKSHEQCSSIDSFQKENQRRLNVISETCQKSQESQKNDSFPLRSTELQEWFHFIKYHLSWCPVYKAASSTTIAHFCREFNSDLSKCQGHTTAAVFRKLPFWRTGSRDATHFMIVREPFHRMLSAYRDKVENFAQYKDNRDAFIKMMVSHRSLSKSFNKLSITMRFYYAKYAIDWFGSSMTMPKPDSSRNPYLDPPYPTFTEYVAALMALEWRNEHLSPASSYCGPCGARKYHYLIKQETYSCEMDSMLRLTTGTGMLDEKFSADNVHSGPSTDETQFLSYFAVLSDSLLDSVLDYYRNDCDMFEYGCEDTLGKIKEYKENHTDIAQNYLMHE